MREVINICNFVKEVKKNDVQVINYVYETDESVYSEWKYCTYCKIFYVTSGKGIFHTNYSDYEIEKGDIFIEFPAQHYSIENVDELKFAYISFIGTSAIDVMDNLGISPLNCVYKQVKKVEKIWIDNLNVDESIIDIASEGVLFITLTEIGKLNAVKKPKATSEINLAHQIKKYVDDHFTDIDFNLDKISKDLSYNPKYISRVFSKNIKSTISEYCNSLRIKYAYSLIKRRVSSIKDIAFACGFQDALYFSKVYKKIMGEVPSQTINKQKVDKRFASKN